MRPGQSQPSDLLQVLRRGGLEGGVTSSPSQQVSDGGRASSPTFILSGLGLLCCLSKKYAPLSCVLEPIGVVGQVGEEGRLLDISMVPGSRPDRRYLHGLLW